MLGDRVETPHADYGWPKCDLCGKPVDSMRSFSNALDDSITIVVECHGEIESVDFPKSMLVGADRLRLDGRAFIQPKRLGTT